MKTLKTTPRPGGIVVVVILVILAVIAILLIVNAILVWRSDKQLESQLAAVRAAGDPISIAELAGEPVPPAENAATYLLRARGDAEALGEELLPVYKSESYSAGNPTEEEVKAIQSAFDAYPKVLPLLQQAAACERYIPPHDYTLDSRAFTDAMLPSVNAVRGTARLVQARVRQLLAQGDRDEAAANCVLLMRLCRHFDREPMCVGYLVSLACHTIAIQTTNQVLRAGPVSKESRQSLESQLALFNGEDAYQQSLKTERAYGIEAYRDLPSRNNWFTRFFWNRDELTYFTLLDHQLALTSRPYSECRTTDSRQNAPVKAGRMSLASSILPALQASRRAMERTQTLVRCLRVLNALQGRTEQNGATEPRLSDLELPSEVTIDPFTDRPLIVKKQPEGWLVYSVGSDLKDDGGKLEDWSDFGVGP